MRHRTTFGNVVALALVLVVVACSSPQRRASEPKAAVPPTTELAHASPESIADVIFGEIPAIENDALLQLASNRVGNACMKRAGFVVKIRRFRRAIEVWAPYVNQREKWGFYLSVTPEMMANESSYDKSVPGEAERYDRVAFGDAKDVVQIDHGDGTPSTLAAGGCNGLKIKQLYGGIEKYTAQLRIRHLAELALELVDPDDHAKADLAYGACMSAHGLPYDKPGAAYRMLKQKYATPGIDRASLKKEEIRVAVFDAECVEAAGLPDLFRRASADLVASSDPAIQNEISTVMEARQYALERAPEVLANANQQLGVDIDGRPTDG